MVYWHWLMSLMKLNAILFDLDGTLVDSALDIGIVLNQMRLERNLESLEINKYREWVSLGAQDLIANSMEISFLDVPPLLVEFRTRYSSHKSLSTNIFPFVEETLIKLKDLGVLMGVCSNKPIELCHKVLRDLNLINYFSSVVGGGSTSIPKPSSEPVDLALTQLGSTAQNTLLVGDSTVDQRTSKNSGLPFIFFSSGYDDGVDLAEVSGIIKSMSDLIPLMKIKGWI